MKLHQSSLYIYSLFIAGLSFNAYAQLGTAPDPATLLGPKSLGRAGATVASELDHDAIFQNIASAAFAQKYTISGAYIGAGDAMTASIVDTKSGPIGGALTYLHRDLKSNIDKNAGLGSYQRSEDRAAVGAFGRLSDELAVGVAVKYAYRKTYNQAFPNKKSFNFDLGAKYLISPRLSFGIVGQNLMSDEAGLDVRVLSGGFEYLLVENLIVSVQASKASLPEPESNLTLPEPDKLVGWAAGAQYKYTDFSFRAGYADRSAWAVKYFTLGVGYEVKGFSLDYAFLKSTSNPSFITHSVSLSAFL